MVFWSVGWRDPQVYSIVISVFSDRAVEEWWNTTCRAGGTPFSSYLVYAPLRSLRLDELLYGRSAVIVIRHPGAGNWATSLMH